MHIFHKKNHLPNAFIFNGNEGIGKEAHAIEFFALLNCNNHENNFACGKCASCRKTANLQHELLQVITPLPKSRTINKNDILHLKTKYVTMVYNKKKHQNNYFDPKKNNLE